MNVCRFCLVCASGKFYCKPHYCYRLSGYAQRKRPAPSPTPVIAKVHSRCWLANKKEMSCLAYLQMLCVDRSTRANRESDVVWSGRPLDCLTLLFSTGEPGTQTWCDGSGCPWKGDGGCIPLSRAPALRYPTLLSCCSGRSLPSG